MIESKTELLYHYNNYIESFKSNKERNEDINLTDKKFIGYIFEGMDPKGEGRYLVYLPELFRLDIGLQPIWLPNHVSNHRWTTFIDPKNIPNTLNDIEKFSCGSYFPLHPGMKVLVEFFDNNEKSGKIVEVINRYNDLVPLEPTNRDSLNLIRKTIENTWVYIDEAKQYLHLMFHNGFSNLTMDEHKLSIGIGKPIDNGIGGIKHELAAEFGETGFYLKFRENTFIKVDDTGIVANIGKNNETYLKMTAKDITLKTDGDINLIGKNVNQYSENSNITANDSVQVYSNETKITGAQLCNIVGNNVLIKGLLSSVMTADYTFIDSNEATDIRSDKILNINKVIKTEATLTGEVEVPTINPTYSALPNNTSNSASGLGSSSEQWELSTNTNYPPWDQPTTYRIN